MRLDRGGTVVLLDMDPTVGHEQRGVRPCVVVSDPDVVSDQRFPLLCAPQFAMWRKAPKYFSIHSDSFPLKLPYE